MIDTQRFTIFRPENTLEPIQHDEIADQSRATGLGIENLVKLKPERLAVQWLAAEIPFRVQLDDDKEFLAVADEIRSNYISSNPADEKVATHWQEIVSGLKDYHHRIREGVDAAVGQVFDQAAPLDDRSEVHDVVHKIQRLITLRRDLGFSDFDQEQIRSMTGDLAVAYFYNREANERVKGYVRQSIKNAISGSPHIRPLVYDPQALKKNIHVSGGQGAGKTTLSRSVLGIKKDQEQFVRINKDAFRPLVLSPSEAAQELDLNMSTDRRVYGMNTEDELNMIKIKQWQLIEEYSRLNKLPQMLIDSTAVGDESKTDILVNNNTQLTLLYVNTPFNIAKQRMIDRAVGDGIPGVDTLRESLPAEMLAGHRNSSLEVVSMLIHAVGKPIKIKVLDGISAEKSKPVQASANLQSGILDVYNVQALLEVFHKSQEGRTAKTPREKDLLAQIHNFPKIAAVMSKINFWDHDTRKIVASFDNVHGVHVHDEALYDKHSKDVFTADVLDTLKEFHQSKKAIFLKDVAENKGHIFQQRAPFKDDEPLQIMTGVFETEVPVVAKSAYVGAAEDEQILEWRHLAKRGQFLDGGFDPWRNKAPSDIQVFAARQVVDRWLSDDIVEAIADTTAAKFQGALEPVVVHISHPMKDYTRPGVNVNYMVLVYGKELTNRLNEAIKDRHPEMDISFVRDRPLLALASDKATRTTASALQRLTSQPLYDPTNFKDGDNILFADEHVQAGGVMLAGRNLQALVDINIVGYTAMSCHNLGVNLRIDPTIAKTLDLAIVGNAKTHGGTAKEFGKDLDHALSSVGLVRGALSNIEGLILIAYLIDGRDEAKCKWFYKLKDSVGVEGIKIHEGKDSLEAIVRAEAITPKELQARIEKQIDKSRRAVYPNVGMHLG